MKTFKILILFAAGYGHCFAKNLDSVVPPSSNMASASNAALDGKLRLSTSFGPASLSVEEANYKIGGASEIIAEYKFMDTLFGSTGVWGAFKYLPLSSATVANNEEVSGVMNGIFFGGTLDFGLPMEKWSAFAFSDIGGFLPNFENEKEDAPSDFLAGIMIGGGANFELTERFVFGPKLSLASGGFNFWHVSFNATFAF